MCLSLHPAVGLKNTFLFPSTSTMHNVGAKPRAVDRARQENPLGGRGILTFQVMPWYPPPGSRVGSSSQSTTVTTWKKTFPARINQEGNQGFGFWVGKIEDMGGRTLSPSGNWKVSKCTDVMKPLVRPPSLSVRKPVKGAILCMIKDNPAVQRLYRRTSTF